VFLPTSIEDDATRCVEDLARNATSHPRWSWIPLWQSILGLERLVGAKKKAVNKFTAEFREETRNNRCARGICACIPDPSTPSKPFLQKTTITLSYFEFKSKYQLTNL
jgi:hypothetical protein